MAALGITSRDYVIKLVACVERVEEISGNTRNLSFNKVLRWFESDLRKLTKFFIVWIFTAMDQKSENINKLKVKREINEVKLKSQPGIDAKLRYYESQCRRYSLQKIKLIQRCIREEPETQICSLDNYGIGSLQCQIIFDTFCMDPLTNMAIISLKNNHIEHFCCHAISLYIQKSNSLKELYLDGCK